MTATTRCYTFLVAWFVLAGCAAAPDQTTPTIEVDVRPFQIVVGASGELKAAQSTPIKVPPQLPDWQTVRWLANEGDRVAEGEPIIVFSDLELSIDEAAALSKVSLEDLRIKAAERGFDQAELRISNELEVISSRREVAETFAPRNELIFSRNEIIDAAIDLEFLDINSSFLFGETEKVGLRRKTDLELLELQRRTHTVKLDQIDQARTSLIIRAPHDGIFLLSEWWRDGDLQVGTKVYPGWRLGDLPDLGKMQAKVHVHESEASGLKIGLAAEIVLDSCRNRSFEATVESLSGVAAAIENRGPARYFEVTLAISESDTAVLRPKHRVTAKIFIARLEGVLTVPNQAIFTEGPANWVFKKSGSGFDKAEVGLGRRGPTMTVINSGLEAGDVIALAAPREG